MAEGYVTKGLQRSTRSLCHSVAVKQKVRVTNLVWMRAGNKLLTLEEYGERSFLNTVVVVVGGRERRKTKNDMTYVFCFSFVVVVSAFVLFVLYATFKSNVFHPP